MDTPAQLATLTDFKGLFGLELLAAMHPASAGDASKGPRLRRRVGHREHILCFPSPPPSPPPLATLGSGAAPPPGTPLPREIEAPDFHRLLALYLDLLRQIRNRISHSTRFAHKFFRTTPFSWPLDKGLAGKARKAVAMGEASQSDLPSTAAYKHAIRVSYEMTVFVGRGRYDAQRFPPDALLIGFGDIGEPALHILAADDLPETDLIVLALNRAMCLRLFKFLPENSGSWYLPAEIRSIGRAIVDIEGDGEAIDLLRAAKSTELFCAVFEAFVAGRMVGVQGATTLCERDVARVAAAHQLMVEHWRERLTVSKVARHCGIGKEKLTRGFRELYRCTLPEAMAARRLDHARQLLSCTDLPIANVGYASGYANSASFTRAFSRHYGMNPSEMRRREQTSEIQKT